MRLVIRWQAFSFVPFAERDPLDIATVQAHSQLKARGAAHLYSAAIREVEENSSIPGLQYLTTASSKKAESKDSWGNCSLVHDCLVVIGRDIT